MLGENGLIRQAEKSGLINERAKVKEIAGIAKIDSIIEHRGNISDETALSAIFAELAKQGYEVKTVANGGQQLKGILIQDTTGTEITELNLQQGETSTIKVNLDMEEGTQKHYVLIQGAYYEIGIVNGEVVIEENGATNVGETTYTIKLTPPSGGVKLVVGTTEITEETTIVDGAEIEVTAGQTIGDYGFNVEVENTAHTENVILKVVSNPLYATGLTLSTEGNATEVEAGSELQIEATMTPNTATDSVEWRVISGSATIDNSGLLKISNTAEGNTTITIGAKCIRSDGTTSTVDEKQITVTIKEKGLDLESLAKGPNGKPLATEVTMTNHEGIEAEDTLGNAVKIPGGFKVASDSGSTVKEGIVVEDEIQNQFIWIPVSNIDGEGSNPIKIDETNSVEITLGRYSFAKSSPGTSKREQNASRWDYDVLYQVDNPLITSDYHVELVDKILGANEVAKSLQDFVESVRDNHGYYLARYEASYGSGSSVSDYKPISKVSTANSVESMNYKTGTLWNFISQSEASKVCQNMYLGDSYVESDLVNSYAWDTAIVYIQAMGNSNYANQGRGTNTSLLDTGTTGDEKCKIFDMSGNALEWTTEYASNSRCTWRGGSYISDTFYVAYRSASKVGTTGKTLGFRPILYIKN